jgi:hypothetical protein
MRAVMPPAGPFYAFHPVSDLRDGARLHDAVCGNRWSIFIGEAQGGGHMARGRIMLERPTERLARRLRTSMVPLVLLVAACEDEGNAGDDNLLTGGSLIVVLIIAAIVAVVLLRRRR